MPSAVVRTATLSPTHGGKHPVKAVTVGVPGDDPYYLSRVCGCVSVSAHQAQSSPSKRYEPPADSINMESGNMCNAYSR